MLVSVGIPVEHPEFGMGVVEEVLGNITRVNFFGEKIDVSCDELSANQSQIAAAVSKGRDNLETQRIEFRRAFEAINLGVVPPDPQQLIDLTIGGISTIGEIQGWLDGAASNGLCKAVFGYYGSGKSHYLNLLRCVALEMGWVVSYLEFDPKEADPAKPHLVYRNLMSALEFPEREDGTKTEGFFGFVKEVRDNWSSKLIRHLKLLRSSPWFSRALEILINYPHSQDQEYQSSCNWLAGDFKSFDIINRLGRNKGYKYKLPRMPVTKETAEIYVFHMAVLGELCRTLGYSGLLFILDEAEHVRSYNVKRKERANNFFDILARAAHRPTELEPPYFNEHGFDLPSYWNSGPHFSLFVGLTEGNIFADRSLNLREACVFLHGEEDMVSLSPPGARDYRAWCIKVLNNFYMYYPEGTKLLSENGNVEQIASTLAEVFEKMDNNTAVLRNFAKLLGLVPCMILSGNGKDIGSVIDTVNKVASQYLNDATLPWDIRG